MNNIDLAKINNVQNSKNWSVLANSIIKLYHNYQIISVIVMIIYNSLDCINRMFFSLGKEPHFKTCIHVQIFILQSLPFIR